MTNYPEEKAMYDPNDFLKKPFEFELPKIDPLPPIDPLPKIELPKPAFDIEQIFDPLSL